MRIIFDNHVSRSGEKWVSILKKNDKPAYKKLRQDLDYLELFGKAMLKGGKKPESIKPLRDGIWQIRVDDYRVLFFFYDENTIVVTNGFTKEQNNTPPGEIDKSIDVKELYTKTS